MQFKVYLAGRVDTDWRDELINECFKDFPNDIHFIDPAEVEKEIYGKLVTKEAGFCPVSLNLSLIDSSNLLIALFSPPESLHVPIGTSAEVFYAYSKNKPVITLVPEKLRKHPWLEQMSTMIIQIPFREKSFPLFSPVFPDEVKKQLRTFVKHHYEQEFGKFLHVYT